MDKKRAVLKVTVYAVISDILKWILTKGRTTINPKRDFQAKDLKGVFVIVDELEALRDTEEVLFHFQVSAVGNPNRYPIDILEVVCRKECPNKRTGIYIRFRGGEVPITLHPNILVLDDLSLDALVGVIIDSNDDLLSLINQSSGGTREIKRSGK